MIRELPELLDLIYHAATCPTGWNPVLRRIADMTDCIAAGITIEEPVTKRGSPITYFGFDANHVEKTFDHFLPMNPLFNIAHSMTTGFIVANGDVIAPRDFAMTDFYNGWARPQGIGSPLTLVLDHGANFYCPLTLVRPDGKGEAVPAHRKLLRTLSPHLTRAMRVHLKLEAADARLEASDAVFENAGIAIFLLNETGSLIFCNRKAEWYLRDGSILAVSTGVLRAHGANHDFCLQNAVAKALARTAATGTDFTLNRQDQTQLHVSVTPVPSTGTGSIYGPSRVRCAVMISEPDTQVRNAFNRLSQVHGLTPAERRVLEVMLAGTGTVKAADALGISAETTRTHLKRIFSKTGTTRQAELMRLFMDAGQRNQF